MDRREALYEIPQSELKKRTNQTWNRAPRGRSGSPEANTKSCRLSFRVSELKNSRIPPEKLASFRNRLAAFVHYFRSPCSDSIPGLIPPCRR